MKYASFIALAVFLAAVLSNRGSAQDWPRFRGPDGAGHGVVQELPVEFTAEDYNWRVELPGPGHSSPVIKDRHLYLTCTVEGSGLTMVCLDAGDGQLLWKRPIEVEAYKQHGDNSLAGATPAVDAEGVYLTFVSAQQRFAVAFGHDGTPLWRKPIGPFRNGHGAGASAVVVEGLVIVPNESELEGSSLTALDPSTGETRWRLERDASPKGPFSTPTVYRNPGGELELISAGHAHGITSVDPKTGSIHWEVATNFKNRCVGSPVVADGLIILTGGSGGGGKEFAAVRPASADPTKPGAIVHQELRRGLPYVPTSIAVGKWLFLWADGGIVTCVEAATGKLAWQERIAGKYYSSPVCIDQRLYNMSRDGQLLVLAAGDKFEELASIELGEPTQASPAIAGGRLYLRTLTHLISVGR